MMDDLKNVFQKLTDQYQLSDSLVKSLAIIGFLTLAFFALKFIFAIFQGFRLYVWSRLCGKPNYPKKYGKWAVVTGSTDGIGLSMAKWLARNGHSIIVIGRNQQKLDKTKEEILTQPNVGDVLTVKIDLSDSSAQNYERIREQIDPDNRDIGILVNNAGTFPDTFTRFNNFDMDYIANLVNVNVLGVLYMTRMILPGMVNRGKGLVLNVSSILGSIPAPYMSTYGPSKSFVDAFSRQLQIEYSSHPIDIINLTPGAVHTKLFTQVTSTIPKPTLMNPSPDDYANSALTASSTGIGDISGTIFHGVSKQMGLFFDNLGLIPILFRLNIYMNARSYSLSPVVKRKRNSQGSNENNQ